MADIYLRCGPWCCAEPIIHMCERERDSKFGHRELHLTMKDLKSHFLEEDACLTIQLVPSSKYSNQIVVKVHHTIGGVL